jgi:uncharacterized protein
MKLNLRRLKLHPRESEQFPISTEGNDQFLAELGGRFVQPIEGEAELENIGSMFTGRGSVRTGVMLPCSRCLQEKVFPVAADFDLVLVEHAKSSALDSDEDVIIFDGDEADIESEIQQAIFMALPICPLCSGDCLGLSPVCGQDRNAQPCHCVEDKVDPRLAKLKDLL